MSPPGHAAAAAIVFAVAAWVAAPASAAPGVGFSGQAPLVCSAGIVSAPAAAGAADSPVALGQLNEFCNDPDGFDVWIDYPPTLAKASLIVDGRAQRLTALGTIRVSHASRPGQASLSLALSGQPAVGPVGLTVRVVPTRATVLALSTVAP